VHYHFLLHTVIVQEQLSQVRKALKGRNFAGRRKEENNIWAPKTLRITDPEEATKSSIFASLGIKPDEKGIFKSFRSELLVDGKTPESPQAQQANPAAVSRSQSFQEMT
jgi:hypothetical protein